jgi:ectoine hydroxylase-related dioxygenase (phytanoyl-CoA dioxygenase family)
LQPPVAPCLTAGDVLAFDYRILHRGLANTSESVRAVLCVTVGELFFKDIVNYPSRSIAQTKATCADVL